MYIWRKSHSVTSAVFVGASSNMPSSDESTVAPSYLRGAPTSPRAVPEPVTPSHQPIRHKDDAPLHQPKPTAQHTRNNNRILQVNHAVTSSTDSRGTVFSPAIDNCAYRPWKGHQSRELSAAHGGKNAEASSAADAKTLSTELRPYPVTNLSLEDDLHNNAVGFCLSKQLHFTTGIATHEPSHTASVPSVAAVGQHVQGRKLHKRKRGNGKLALTGQRIRKKAGHQTTSHQFNPRKRHFLRKLSYLPLEQLPPPPISGCLERNLPPIAALPTLCLLPTRPPPAQWSLDHVQSPVRSLEPLPSVRVLCQPVEGFSMKHLKAAARIPRHRKVVPALIPGSLACGMKSMELPGSANGQTTPVGNVGKIEELRSQNEKLSHEVLVLREELVLACCSSSRQSSLKEVGPSIRATVDKDDPSFGIRTGFHTAKTLVHMAAMAGSCRVTSIPRELLTQFVSSETSNAYILCAQDGFNYIRGRMEKQITGKGALTVANVFADVHLKVTQDLFKQCNKEGVGHEHDMLQQYVGFVVSQISEVYQEFLKASGAIRIEWNSTFCMQIVRPLLKVLECLSPKFGNDLEQVCCAVLANAADLLRKGEDDKNSIAVTSLCHALEVSMGIGVNAPASALLLAKDDVYAIGRQNRMFAHHVFFLLDEREMEKRIVGDV